MTDAKGPVEVGLIGVPIDKWRRASAHQEVIQREFDIIKADLPGDSVPHQFASLLKELDLRFGGVGDPTWRTLYEAAERGESEIDLVFRVPVEAAAAAERLGEMFESVDDFCRAGERLLTVATPADLASFRRWFLGEFTRQVDYGLEPVPWRDFELGVPQDDLPQPRSTSSEAADVETIRFEGDLDLATAGSLRNQILAARGHGHPNLVIDLSQVRFIDSVGLSLLVTLHARLVEEGVQMRLVLPAMTRRLFEISGLIELLHPEFVGDEAGTRHAGSD